MIQTPAAAATPMTSAMERLGVTPEEYLRQRMWFLEGNRQPQCQKRDAAAFTEPCSHVVYVCTSRIVTNHESLGDVVVIHEMLHSLGLPENPPTPREITERVRARCSTSPRK